MMIAKTLKGTARRLSEEPVVRTLPRIVLQMETSSSGNPKLKPTVYLSSLELARASLVSR